MLFNPDKPFRPTKRECNKWFDHYNELIFDNKLKRFKKITFHGLLNGGDAWAITFGDVTQKRRVRYCSLKMRKAYPSFPLFVITLVHEMVHNYEWLYHGRMTHGKTFYAWQERVEKCHIPLETVIGEVVRVTTEKP